MRFNATISYDNYSSPPYLKLVNPYFAFGNPLYVTTLVATNEMTANAYSIYTPIKGSGGYGGFSYSVWPNLPAGLTLNASTGAVSGTPTATSPAKTYIGSVTDSSGQKISANFTLSVLAAPFSATTAVASTTLTANQAATPFTPVTGAGGVGALTYSVSPALPAGLALNASTGQITGTPSVLLPAASFTVTVRDSSPTPQTATASFQLGVVPRALSAATAVAVKSLAANTAATAFTPVTGSGGFGALSYAVSPALPAGLTLNASTGQIAGTPTALLASTTFTVTVRDSATPTAQSATGTFSLAVNPPGLSAVTAVASTTLTANAAATAFTPVTGSGGFGALSYAVSPALPAGLALNASTGQITGTPTALLASTTFTVTVRDSATPTAESATGTFSLAVNPPGLSAVTAVASTTLTANTVATAFTPVTGSGGFGALSYAVSPALPAGLALNASTGQITGTPTALLASTTFTVTVRDSATPTAQSAMGTFSLAVNPHGMSVALAASSTQLILGQPVTFTATVTPASATGVVTFMDGEATLGSAALSGGVARFTTSALSLGEHSIVARYAAQGVFAAAASAPVTLSNTRPEPSRSVQVRALVQSQANMTRTAAMIPIMAVGARLDRLHGDVEPIENGFRPIFLTDPTTGDVAGIMAFQEEQARLRDGEVVGRTKQALPWMTTDKNGAPIMAQHSPAPASRKPTFARAEYNIWTAGYVIVGRNSPNDDAKSRTTSDNFVIGVDKAFRSDLKAGVSVGVGRDRVKYDGGDSNNGRTLTASLYASWNPFGKVFVDGMAGYGDLQFKMARFDANAADRLTGDRQGRLAFGSIALSYDQTFSQFRISPFLRYEAFQANLQGYTESGPALWTLRYDATSMFSQGFVAGVRGQFDYDAGWGTVSPMVRAEYRRGRAGGLTQDLGYASDSSASYSIHQPGSSTNTIATSVGLKVRTESIDASLEYLNYLSPGEYRAQGVRGAFGLRF